MIAAHYVDAYRLAPDDADAEELRDHASEACCGPLSGRGRSRRRARPSVCPRRRSAPTEGPPSGRSCWRRPASRRSPTADRRRDRAVRRRPTSCCGAGRLHASPAEGRQAEALFLEGRIDESVDSMDPAYAVRRDQGQDADLAALAAEYGRMLGFVNRPNDRSSRWTVRSRSRSGRASGDLSHAMNTKGLVGLSGAGAGRVTPLLGALRWPRRRRIVIRCCARTSTWATRGSGRSSHRARTSAADAGARIGDRNWERVPDAPGGRPVPQRRLGRGYGGGGAVAEDATASLASAQAIRSCDPGPAGRSEGARAAWSDPGSRRAPGHAEPMFWAWSMGMQTLAAGRVKWRRGRVRLEAGGCVDGFYDPAAKGAAAAWPERALWAGDAVRCMPSRTACGGCDGAADVASPGGWSAVGGAAGGKVEDPGEEPTGAGGDLRGSGIGSTGC